MSAKKNEDYGLEFGYDEGEQEKLLGEQRDNKTNSQMQILGDLVHSHKNLDKDIFQHNSAAQDSLSEKQMNMIESKSLLRSSLE